MNLLEKYKSYRKIQVALHLKILDSCVSGDDFKKGAAILGIIVNNRIVIESDTEKDALYDFNIYGNIRNGRNALSEYIDKHAAANKGEEEILTAMKCSDALLYEITDTMKDGVVILKDIFNKLDNIKLVDIGLSKSINPNVLLFTRLLHFDEFSMTSGLGFVFLKNHEDYLIKRSRKMIKKIKSGDDSTDRFISFFLLNRSDGIPVFFEEIVWFSII